MTNALDMFKAQREAAEALQVKLTEVAALVSALQQAFDRLALDAALKDILQAERAWLAEVHTLIREARAFRESQFERYRLSILWRWVLACAFALAAMAAAGAGYVWAAKPYKAELVQLRDQAAFADLIERRVAAMTPAERQQFEKLLKLSAQSGRGGSRQDTWRMPLWYRCTDWTAENESEFFRRLKRARNQRPQYLLIQAVTLVDTGRPELAEVALTLIERYEHEHPDDSLSSNAFETKARALMVLERQDDAFQAFEDALSARRARPNVINDAWLEYPLLIAERLARDHYQRALDVLKEFVSKFALAFPIHQFRYFAVVALISADQGDHEGAARWARNALAAVPKPAPFSRHPDVGVVGTRYVDLRAELEKLVAE